MVSTRSPTAHSFICYLSCKVSEVIESIFNLIVCDILVDAQSDYHVKTYGSLLTTTGYDNGIRLITSPPELAINHRTTIHHRHGTQHKLPKLETIEVCTKIPLYDHVSHTQ